MLSYLTNKVRDEKSIMKNWPKTDSKTPLVSVCVATFNHEKYICKALDSILEQDTSFSFEIVVRDDASTDGTTEIIKKYKELYPNIIKLVIESENTYSKCGYWNFFEETLKHSTGEYVAFCEGDDYWTNPHKLQKQIGFLESNPKFIGCIHNTRYLIAGTETNETVVKKYLDTYEFVDFFDAYAHTSSYVFRHNNQNIINSYLKQYYGDWYMLLIFSSLGPVKYINEIMSTYRIHDKGIYSGSNKEDQLIKYLQNCLVFSNIFKGYKKDFLDLFTASLHQPSDKLLTQSIDHLLDKVDIESIKHIILKQANINKKNNETIKECSHYIQYLEEALDDRSIKSFIKKLIRVVRLDLIIKKIKK